MSEDTAIGGIIIGEHEDIRVSIFNPLSCDNPAIPRRMYLKCWKVGTEIIHFEIPHYLVEFKNTIKIEYIKES